jgi:hypothetical protein
MNATFLILVTMEGLVLITLGVFRVAVKGVGLDNVATTVSPLLTASSKPALNLQFDVFVVVLAFHWLTDCVFPVMSKIA